MSAVEDVARRWHEGSDHTKSGSPFGGHLCNCLAVAERMLPLLVEAWDRGYTRAHLQHHDHNMRRNRYSPAIVIDNPYEEARSAN